MRPTWTRTDRALIVLLFLVYIPGTPGLGVDTREPGANGALIGTAYGLTTLLLVVAFGASWKWPRVATWCALGGGALAVLLSVLDLASLLGPPPPGAIVALDLIQVVLGLVIVWRRWTAVRMLAPA